MRRDGSEMLTCSLSRLLQHFRRVLLEDLKAPLAERPVDHARLAEPAAADAPALDLEDDAVLRRADKADERLLRIDRVGHVRADLAAHGLREIVIQGLPLRDEPVLVIRNLIEVRSVDTGDLHRCPVDELISRIPVFFHGLVEVHEIIHDRLRLPDVEEVKERGDRLRIVGAGPAAHDDGTAVLPL